VDIKREPPKKRGRYIIGGVSIAAVIGITAFLMGLKPAAPAVDRATLWIDTVRQGTMVRQVRAPGTLVPEQLQFVTALTSGRIERLPIRPGTPVKPGDVILEMTNPDVQLQLLSAQQQRTAAEGNVVSLRMQLQSQVLQQQAQIAQLHAQLNEAKRQYTVFQSLAEKKLSSANELERAKETADDLESRLKYAENQLKITEESAGRQIALQQAQVDRMRAIEQFQADRQASMVVRAPSEGVLQELGSAAAGQLELGQYVNAGQTLARIAQPGRLKAVLRVPETQAKDVAVSQPVSVDTRNGLWDGRVMRIDPAAQNGTVTVEVALEGTPPPGVRPELSVDGTIEIERLVDVMYVGRPAYGQAESTVGLFRLDPDGKYAQRISVKLGRSSVNTIEVSQGLNVGDKVIISDMSQWDNVDRVRLR
jgi:multidrug efflux pump subunit AcrA (membrane-fusion protein)